MPNHIHGILEIKFSKCKSIDHTSNATFSSPSQSIGAIIRGYKGATTKKIKILSTERNSLTKNGANDQGEGGKDKREGRDQPKGGDGKGELPFALTDAPTKTLPSIGLEDKVWQRNYYEHIIRDERAYHNIANYIRTNPLRWKEDKFFG